MAPPRLRSGIELLEHSRSKSRERGSDHSAENDLKRLVADVRAARERLAALIDTIRKEHGEWPEREHRWEQWRAEIRGSRRSRIH
jgi:hypothetical protein